MGNAFDRLNRGFGSYGSRHEASAQSPGYKKERPSYVNPVARPQVKEHVPSADFVASDTSNLQAGQKVEHQKFGFGEVMKMEGAAHNPIATVKFELNGEKKIMLNYAKLRIVE
jgi:DNA helicase-2/ATP-dependent DNA helicase PcrA